MNTENHAVEVELYKDPEDETSSDGWLDWKKVSEGQPLALKLLLGSLGFLIVVYLFCKICCQKKKSNYTEFEDAPGKDDIA